MNREQAEFSTNPYNHNKDGIKLVSAFHNGFYKGADWQKSELLKKVKDTINEDPNFLIDTYLLGGGFDYEKMAEDLIRIVSTEQTA